MPCLRVLPREEGLRFGAKGRKEAEERKGKESGSEIPLEATVVSNFVL